MAILFTVVSKRNPQNKEAAPLYYLQALTRGYLEFEDLVILATEDTTLDPNELRMGLARAFAKSEEYLSQGFTIGFGKFGCIKISLSSVGSEKPEEATAEKLRRIRANFLFGKKIKDFMQTIGLERRKI